MGTSVMINSVQAGESCHKISAKGVGQQLSEDITVAYISGGGLLNGATFGEFSTTDVDPPVLTFEGTVTFITNHGILAVAVTGMNASLKWPRPKVV